jgi:hypothetical protein
LHFALKSSCSIYDSAPLSWLKCTCSGKWKVQKWSMGDIGERNVMYRPKMWDRCCFGVQNLSPTSVLFPWFWFWFSAVWKMGRCKLCWWSFWWRLAYLLFTEDRLSAYPCFFRSPSEALILISE